MEVIARDTSYYNAITTYCIIVDELHRRIKLDSGAVQWQIYNLYGRDEWNSITMENAQLMLEFLYQYHHTYEREHLN